MGEKRHTKNLKKDFTMGESVPVFVDGRKLMTLDEFLKNTDADPDLNRGSIDNSEIPAEDDDMFFSDDDESDHEEGQEDLENKFYTQAKARKTLQGTDDEVNELALMTALTAEGPYSKMLKFLEECRHDQEMPMLDAEFEDLQTCLERLYRNDEGNSLQMFSGSNKNFEGIAETM